MAAARPATRAYLHALFGRSQNDHEARDATEQLLAKLDAGDERDEDSIAALRTALGGVLHRLHKELVGRVAYAERQRA